MQYANQWQVNHIIFSLILHRFSWAVNWTFVILHVRLYAVMQVLRSHWRPKICSVFFFVFLIFLYLMCRERWGKRRIYAGDSRDDFVEQNKNKSQLFTKYVPFSVRTNFILLAFVLQVFWHCKPNHNLFCCLKIWDPGNTASSFQSQGSKATAGYCIWIYQNK